MSKIIADFPEFTFKKSQRSHWSHEKNTVFYSDEIELLHELGHALLGHKYTDSDVDLLKKERAAWTKARELAKKYRVKLSDDMVEERLDSYRRWLHKRSLCPKCRYNGLEQDGRYHCIMCGHHWTAK
ncbi:MAG: hypothetical protein LBK50_02535 [Candidatus Nomurabacteria bacterium]|jgi:hypothetical protein|nr:hypothetical protein [Candidatus Nomurabacteria bacterium]